MRARKRAPNSRENSTNKDYLLGNKQSLLKIWRLRNKNWRPFLDNLNDYFRSLICWAGS